MNDLRRLLNNTQAAEVSVRFDQVQELIGEEQAFELALSASSLNQKPQKNIRGRRIRSQSFGLATYNRKELIDAIDEAPKAKEEDEGASSPENNVKQEEVNKLAEKVPSGGKLGPKKTLFPEE